MENSLSPMSAIDSFRKHRKLIYQLAKREVIGRYRGSIAGLAWSFFNPLLMLAVYTFVFSYVMKARWGTSVGGDRSEFAVILFVGIMVHGFLTECISRGPMLILSNASYVKKVIFPLEILNWSAVASSFFHMVITLLVLLCVQYLFMGHIPLTVFYFPLVIFPIVILAYGFTAFFAALGVYYRDLSQVTGIIATVMLFMSPALYPISSLPLKLQKIIYLNPLTFMIEQSRNVLLWGLPPDWIGLLEYFIGSIIFAYLGYLWFQLTRRGFADVV
ncbi:ABC transporter permease [Dyella sp. KRB-257]|uniref:ABC transporter permease n=1 Tax=Dyella sp. KRB-257 TaxID=3400915 RepID=UPI003C081E2A